MKIEIEIDDKYIDRNIWVFAGVEPVARRYFHKKYWETKIQNCSQCGECCKMIKENHPFGTPDGCKYLVISGTQNLCGLGHPQMGLWRPHGCSIANSVVLGCTVKWEKIK